MLPIAMGEVAKLFAEVEPDFPASYFRRQLTHYVQLGLVKPPVYRGAGPKAAGLLTERQVCAAYLFSTLTRLGLPAETLRGVGRYFDYIGIRVPGRADYFGSLNEVILTTKAGKHWFLVVKIRNWRRSENWEQPSVLGEFREQADVSLDTAENRAVVVLDCQHLLRPLLEVLHRQDEADPKGEPNLGS